jgi:hypothetical protein
MKKGILYGIGAYALGVLSSTGNCCTMSRAPAARASDRLVLCSLGAIVVIAAGADFRLA